MIYSWKRILILNLFLLTLRSESKNGNVSYSRLVLKRQLVSRKQNQRKLAFKGIFFFHGVRCYRAEQGRPISIETVAFYKWEDFIV